MIASRARALRLCRSALVTAVALGSFASAAAPTGKPDKPAPAKWCLQQVVDETGNPVVLTVNLAYVNFPRKADYPWILQIVVTTVKQNRRGLPTDEEAAVLNRLEDQLTAGLREATQVEFIGRATRRGARDLTYYVSDPEKANATLTRAAKAHSPRKWEFQMGKDPEWKGAADLIGDKPECL